MSDMKVIIIRAEATVCNWNRLKTSAGFTDNRAFCDHLLDAETTRQNDEQFPVPECIIKEEDGRTECSPDNTNDLGTCEIAQDSLGLNGQEDAGAQLHIQKQEDDDWDEMSSPCTKRKLHNQKNKCLRLKSSDKHFIVDETGQNGFAQHKCTKCALSFEDLDKLKTHVQLRHMKKTALAVECNQCQKTFLSKHKLQNHILRYHQDEPGQNEHCCEQCARRFRTAGLLDKHRQTKHACKAHACTYCPASYNRMSNLTRHMNNIHESGDGVKLNYACRMCDRTFRLKVFVDEHKNEEHLKVKPYECQICSAQFYGKHKLAAHVKSQHGFVQRGFKKSKPYDCDLCDKSFSSHISLDSHKNSIHLRRKPYACDICPARFCSLIALKQHDTRHDQSKVKRKHLCDMCGESFSLVRSLDHHKNMLHLNVKPYICQVCAATFFGKKHLADHVKIVHGLTNHTCDFCQQSFQSPSVLDYHVNSQHLRHRPYSCEQCSASFYAKPHLIKHTNTVHDGVLSIKCRTCKKRFSTPEEFNTHRIEELKRTYQTSAEGEDKVVYDLPPFICNICGKPFVSKHGLIQHELGHRGVKSFTCHHCTMTFTSRLGLRGHLKKVHDEDLPSILTCRCCQQSFSSVDDLNNHRLEVMKKRLDTSGEKPPVHTEDQLTCNTCGRMFSELRHLQNHQSVHNRVKRFVCHLCQLAVSHRYTLKRHMQRVHHEDLAPVYPCRCCNKTFLSLEDFNTHRLEVMSRKCGRIVDQEQMDEQLTCNVCGKFFSDIKLLQSHQLVHSGVKQFVCHVCQHAVVHERSLKKHLLKVHGQCNPN